MLKICAAIYKEKAYSSRIPLILFRRADIISRVMKMIIDDLLKKRNMTRYRLAVQSGVPHTTLNDICSGKTKLEKCSAETVYKLAKTLNVPMELLTENGLRATAREQGLPAYLQHDLNACKDGLKNGSSLMDCLWGELYGSINIAEINDGAITHEHVEYLRQKFLWNGSSI